MKRIATLFTLISTMAAGLLFAVSSTATAHVAIARPGINGTVQVGQVLHATPGQYGFYTGAELHSPPVFTYQWLSNGSPIAGEVSVDLALDPSLVGKQISVTVTNRRGTHAVSATSNSTKPVAAGKLIAGGLAISGQAVVGKTLSGQIGYDWRQAGSKFYPSGSSYTCQWLSKNVVVKTEPCHTGTPPFYDGTYVPSVADVGKQIGLRVTYQAPGYTPVTKTVTRFIPVYN